MNKEKGEKRKIWCKMYIVLGALYVFVKIVFVLSGYLHLGAILHGLIPSVVTMVVGYLALMSLKKTSVFWPKLMVFLPILILVITPLYMFLRERSNWLTNGRLEVLIIYEVLAIFQILIALKKLKEVSR
ncbi:MAG: hypothetical protein CSB16_01295 [Clostridiales bacterium]|nr:MAG: hypothetical protein CSB16_01295 [Clostridiales bacterium]